MAEKSEQLSEIEASLAETLTSPKMRKFVIFFVENGGNATKAAEAAGYAVPAVEGCRLLKTDKVVRAIEAHARKVASVAGENRDTILSRMLNRADADPRDYFEIVRVGDQEVEQLKKITSLTKRQAQCIKKITWNAQGFPSIELYDASAADRDLANIMGYTKREDESLRTEDAAALIAAALDAMDEADGIESPGSSE